MASTLLYHSKIYPVNSGISPTLIFPGGTGHPAVARNGDMIGVRVSSSPSSAVTLDVGANLIEHHITGNTATGAVLFTLQETSLIYIYNHYISTWILINLVNFTYPGVNIAIGAVEISIGGTIITLPE